MKHNKRSQNIESKYEHNVKIKVSLTTEYGSVPVWFILSKTNRWLITQFKTNIEGVLPLAAKEKVIIILNITDVAGTHLYCVFPSQK